MFWGLSEMIHIKWLVRIQEASCYLLLPYGVSGSLLMVQRRRGTEVGWCRRHRMPRDRGRRREYFEAMSPAMNCVWLSWWICSQKWGVEVRLGGLVGTGQQGCVWRVSPPRSVGSWRQWGTTEGSMLGVTDQSCLFIVHSGRHDSQTTVAAPIPEALILNITAIYLLGSTLDVYNVPCNQLHWLRDKIILRQGRTGLGFGKLRD